MKETGATEFDWLKEAISDDTPCGPNLEAADDSSFIDYYFDAEVRLPERYFTPGLKTDSGEGTDDSLFDPKSVDHKKERKNIDGLLKRSRDLRLLSLLARFTILAGRVTDFADAIEGIAILLETYPDDVHPAIGKSASNRRMPLDDLGSAVTVTIPLQYLYLTGQPDVTYRRYMVAMGKSNARTGEEDITASQITGALGDAGAKPTVDKVYSALGRAAHGFQRIKTICLGHSDTPFTPNFDETEKTIIEIQALILQARPDLMASAKPKSAAKDGKSAGKEGGKAKTPDAAEITSRDAARAALQAVEQYFASREPSSAAVLLITQARLLIGRPLIEALETLLPEHAKNAVIDFGKETGFALSIDRLRDLSSKISSPPDNMAMQEPSVETKQEPDDGETTQEPDGEAAQEPDGKVAQKPAGKVTQKNKALPQINTRADVAAQIGGVEDYYRQNEPTSPIPILLARATAYLDKDFNAIVAELFPIKHKE